jgi:hypothetical protein
MRTSVGEVALSRKRLLLLLAAFALSTSIRLRHLNAEALFFLFLDDDAWRDHHHEAFGGPADRDVSK